MPTTSQTVDMEPPNSLCTCHAQQVIRVIISGPLQCRWILHLCWGQFISVINIQGSICHLKNTSCQKICLYTASGWGANVEFTIHVGDPDGSKILNAYCIKIKMDSLWPSTWSNSRSLCDLFPFLITEIIFSSIPSSLPLQSGISHWDQSPTN